MRFLLFFAAIVIVSDTLAAERLSGLRVCEELLQSGRQKEALAAFDKLLEAHQDDVELWEKVIRMQMRHGMLEAATVNAESLVALTGEKPPRAEHTFLLKEIYAKQLEELKRIANLKSWDESDPPPEVFAQHVEDLLARTAASHRAETVRALQRTVELLRQSPAEQGHLRTGSRLLPSRQFLGSVVRIPSLLGPVLTLADEGGLTDDDGWRGNLLGILTDAEFYASPDRVMELFTHTPMVAGAGEFRDLSFHQHSYRTLLGEILSMVRYHDRGVLKKRVIQELESRQPRTFGAELVTALLKDENTSAVSEFLDRHQHSFAKLSDDAAGTLLELLAHWYPEVDSMSPLPAELAARLSPLWEAEAWYLDSERLTWQAAGRLEDLKLSKEHALRQADRIFDRLAVRDQRLALDFFDQACRIFGAVPDEALVLKWFEEALRVPELLQPILERADRAGWTARSGWLQRALIQVWRPRDYKSEPRRLLTFLEGAGILGDAETFSARWQTGEKHGASLVSRIVVTLAAQPDSAEIFLPLLEARRPQSFGSEVLLALLKPLREPQIGRIVADYEKELSSLPAGRKAEMAAFMAQWVVHLDDLARVSPALAGPLQPLAEGRRAAALAEAGRIVAAATVDEVRKGAVREMMDLGSRGGDARSPAFEGMAASLAIAMRHDEKLARRAFEKVTNWANLSPSSPGASHSPVLGMSSFSSSGDAGWLLIAARHPELVPEVRVSVTRQHFRPAYGWNSRVEEILVPSSLFGSAQDLVALLGHLGLPGKGPLEFSDPGIGLRSIPEILAHRLRSTPVEVKLAAWKLLDRQQSRTFGQEMILVLLDTDEQQALERLQKRADDLASLPDRSKMVLLRALRQVHAGMSQREGTNKAVDLLLAGEANAGRDYLIELQSAGSANTAPVLNSARLVLEELVRLDHAGRREAAGALFRNYFLTTRPARGASRTPPDWLWARTPLEVRQITQLVLAEPTLEMVAFIANQFAADRTGRLVLSGRFDPCGFKDVLKNQWREAGGWADPGGAMVRVLERLASRLDAASVPLLAQAFHEFIGEIPRAHRSELCSALERLPPHSSIGSLAAEVLAAAALLGNSDPAGPAWIHYQRWVVQGGMSPQVRLSLVAHLCRQYGDSVPADVLRSGAVAAVAAWKEGWVVPDDALLRVLWSFAGLPATPESVVIADDFAREWEKRVQSLSEQESKSSHGESIQVIGRMLSKCSRQTGLDLFQQKCEQKANSGTWFSVILFQSGRSAAAAEHFRDHWAEITQQLAGHGNFRYPSFGAPLRVQQVPLWLADFREGEEELALLAETVLAEAARPDLEGNDPDDAPAWRSWTEDLADRVSRHPVGDPDLRLRVHGLLVKMRPDLIGKLATLVEYEAHRARSMDLAQLHRHYETAWPGTMMAAHALEGLYRGDLSILRSHLSRFQMAARDKTAATTMEQNGGPGFYKLHVLKGLVPAWSDLPAETRVGILGVMRPPVLAGKAGAPAKVEDYAASFVLDVWREEGSADTGGADPKRPYLIEGEASGYQLLADLARGGRKRLPLQLRWRLIAPLLASPGFGEKFPPESYALVQWMKNLPLLEAQEAVAYGEEIDNLMDRQGAAAWELVDTALHLGDEKEALRLLSVSIQKAPPLSAGVSGHPVSHRVAMPGHAGMLMRRPSMGEVAPRAERLLRKAALLIRAKDMAGAKAILLSLPDEVAGVEKQSLLELASPASAR